MKQRLLTLINTPGGAFLCTLFVTYAPFSWILVINENRDEWLKLCPTLPGIIAAELLGALFPGGRLPQWFQWLRVLLSIALPCAVFFLMLQFPSRRLLIIYLAMAFFCALSFVAWLLYLA